MHQVVAVLTREDAPVGRKGVLTPSPVSTEAESLNLPVIKANRINDKVDSEISGFQPDLGVVIAYGSLLKTTTLRLPKHGWLNLHYSLLPLWRGAAPVQHSILSGVKETGVSIFQLDEGMDTGPILTTVPAEIQPGENSGQLLDRLTLLGSSALDECLARIDAGMANFVPQEGVPSFATKISRSDAEIDWQKSSSEIELLVRAMNPEPMAWTTHYGQPVRIIEAQAMLSGTVEISPQSAGTIILKGATVFVACGDDSALRLDVVQPSGKNPMKAADWFRGLKESAVLGG